MYMLHEQRMVVKLFYFMILVIIVYCILCYFNITTSAILSTFIKCSSRRVLWYRLLLLHGKKLSSTMIACRSGIVLVFKHLVE